MPRQRTTGSTKATSRKGNLRNAAVLTLSQVAKLVNLPVAQDVARHIHQITVALKAPKDNDLSAKELAAHIAGLLAVLDIALPYLDGTEGLDSLCSRLRGAHAELENIQASQYTTKLGSQTQFRDRIVQLKEEVYRTVLDLTLKLMVVTLAGNMRNRRQTRRALMRMHKLTTRTHRITMRTQQTTVRQQGALVCAEYRLAISNQRILELEYLCGALQRQGTKHEAILMRFFSPCNLFAEMPAMRRYATPTPGKSNLRNGVLLVLSQTAKHVNLPLVQDLAQHVQRLTLALEAPKTNDSSAQELGNYLARLLGILAAVLPYLKNTDELQRIYDELQGAYAELEDIQESRYLAKLASQTRIQQRIAQIKEDVSQTMVDLMLELLTVTLFNSMHGRQHTHDALMRTSQDVACQEQRIRAFEDLCTVKPQGKITLLALPCLQGLYAPK